MNDMEIKNETLKKYWELLLDIDMLYCKLDRYKDKMTESAFKFGASGLEWLFREEFERTFAPYKIERAQEKYEYKKRRGKLVPRETWFLHRKNLAAKYFIDGVAEDAGGFFAAFKKKLAERKRNRPVRRFFRRLFKRGKPAPATCPPTGVNVLSEQAAPPFIISECVPRSPDTAQRLAEWQRELANIAIPSQFFEPWKQPPLPIDEKIREEIRRGLTNWQSKKLIKEITTEAAKPTEKPVEPAPPTPKNPPKRGAGKGDGVDAPGRKTPKTEKE